jgi:hypothetical protein
MTNPRIAKRNLNNIKEKIKWELKLSFYIYFHIFICW